MDGAKGSDRWDGVLVMGVGWGIRVGCSGGLVGMDLRC